MARLASRSSITHDMLISLAPKQSTWKVSITSISRRKMDKELSYLVKSFLYLHYAHPTP